MTIREGLTLGVRGALLADCCNYENICIQVCKFMYNYIPVHLSVVNEGVYDLQLVQPEVFVDIASV